MIEQLLEIQSSCLSEGAWKTAQLVNALMSQTMAAATESAPEPAKPKRKERDDFEYIPRQGSIMLDFKEVRRLVNAKQAAEGLPIHQIARQMGFDNGTSALPGFRSADKAKDKGYSIHAAKLSRILGDSILIKETPPTMAEVKPLTYHVNENVCLKPTKEKKNMHQAVEVLHPWKQPKAETPKAQHKTPFNNSLKRSEPQEPKRTRNQPEPQPVTQSTGPKRPSHYISESGAFEIDATGRQLLIKPVPSLPKVTEKRQRFYSENPGLFTEQPTDWAGCVALADRADRLYKEWANQ